MTPGLIKEVRALLPSWAICAATLGAAAVWPRGLISEAGFVAYVAGSVSLGAQSIGHEYSHRTLSMLLSQPVSRRRSYLQKSLVLAVMLLSLVLLAWPSIDMAGPMPVERRVALFALPLLVAGLVTPWLTMISRSVLAGVFLTFMAAGFVWLGALMTAVFRFGAGDAAQDVGIGYLLRVLIPMSLAGGVLGWREFMRLETIEGPTGALHLPRLFRAAEGVRRHRPLRALAIKELRLQQLTIVLAGQFVIGWMVVSWLLRVFPFQTTFPFGAVMLMGAIAMPIVIGALASAEERQHGTLDWQLLQPVPAWQQWMVKVGVAFALSMVFGVAAPVVLAQLLPGERFAADLPASLTVGSLLLTAAGLYVSSLSPSGVVALALTLPIGIGTALFLQAARRMLLPLTLNTPGMAIIPTQALAIALLPFLLWFAFRNHTLAERSARRLVQQGALLALVAVITMALAGPIASLD